MKRPILCLDFDGVLHAYTSRWQGATVIPDGPVPGAMAFLKEAVQDFQVCVYSSRSKEPGGIAAMADALRQWLTWEFGPIAALDFIDIIEFPQQKPAAFLTIDDRAITFTGVFPSTDELLAFKTWQQQ